MTTEMPKSFKDGEFGWVPSVMLGGPIDGHRYRMPVLPDGSIPHALGHPVSEPFETSPVAYYEREGDETIGGYYVYLFQGLRGPDGKRVLAMTPVISGTAALDTTSKTTLTAGRRNETCAGFVAPEKGNKHSEGLE